MLSGIRGNSVLNAVIAATAKQPGGSLSDRTLAHPLNGITYFDSHLRGSAERQVHNGFERDNARSMVELLNTQYAPAMQQVMGRRA